MATKTDKQPLALLIWREISGEYMHWRGRVVTPKYENGEQVPYGTDSKYDRTMLYFDGLRVSSQGDARSRLRAGEPLYGLSCEYHDCFTVGLDEAQRMVKTLIKIDKGLLKLKEQRGYTRSFGEYCGRLAEVLGCTQIAIDRESFGLRHQYSRWEFTSIGEGVNAIANNIQQWVREAQPSDVAVEN